MSAIELNRSLERIGYQGSLEPSLETLRGLALAFATTVPFENLNVLSGRGVSLDIADIERKIVHEGRGGYCFEVNGLALRVLRQIGFEAVGLIGRVRWMQPDDHPTGATHMVIHVDLPEGPHIFDVGFGGMRLTGPVRLASEEAQSTPHEDFRIRPDRLGYVLQGDLGDRWATTYRFTLDPQTEADYEIASWFTSTHSKSLFVNHLIVEMSGDGFRRMIVDNMLIERPVGGAAEMKEIASLAEMEDLLQRFFNLTLRDEADREAVSRFIGAPVRTALVKAEP